MNLKKISKALLVLPFTLLIGCNDFLDVNDSPNNPLDVPLPTLLSSALVGTGFANANELNRFGSTVSDYTYGAAGGPQGYDVYALTGGDFGNQWTNELWNGPLIQYQRIIEKAAENGATAYGGAGKIMQAYTWALTTDLWGDIPYSQALKGTEGITRPELDSQEDIYKGNPSKEITGLFDLVRSGIADLGQPSAIAMGGDDIVYAGNVANWRKAGYTLMLKMALTISAKEPGLAAQIINEVITANDYITTNAQNLSVKFGTAVGSQSPIYTYMFVSLFQNDMMVSTRYLNLLEDGANPDDPRLTLFVTKPGATYVTFENGYRGPLPAVTTYSKWGTAVTGVNGAGPVRLITNAMRAFMLAEAVLTIPGVTPPAGQTAQSLFYEGIRASMVEAGVTAGNIDAYIGATAATATPKATLSGTTANRLDQILTQKYIAMTGNGLEAYNDIRRTGLPSHTIPEHANAAGEDGKRPVRARYPDSDIARNPNLGAAVKKTNEKVWWDAN
jgi:hypothetical protein